jgi:hypothetical protein
MSEAVANVRWLIADGIRDLQAMLDELGKLQTDLPRDARAPDEPNHDDQRCLLGPPSWWSLPGRPGLPRSAQAMCEVYAMGGARHCDGPTGLGSCRHQP